MTTLPEKQHRCPFCEKKALLLTDLDSGLPLLSSAGTPIYYCPNCHENVWEGKAKKDGTYH